MATDHEVSCFEIRTLPTASSANTVTGGDLRCPPMVPPGVVTHVGGGMMRDSALPISEVVWVGPECRGVYVGTPTVLRTDTNSTTENSNTSHETLFSAGTLLATHDFFGSTTYNDTVQCYKSLDGGMTWKYISNVTGIYWANIFMHNDGAVYMLGIAGDDTNKVSPPNKIPLKGGPVVIAKSSDLGHTWSLPTILLHGSFQTGSTPVVENNGLLFRSMEESSDFGVGAFVMWAEATSDLTLATSWTRY